MLGACFGGIFFEGDIQMMTKKTEYADLPRRDSVQAVSADLYGGDLRAMLRDLRKRRKEKAYIPALVRRIDADIVLIEEILADFAAHRGG